jgi:hypothetical protein
MRKAASHGLWRTNMEIEFLCEHCQNPLKVHYSAFLTPTFKIEPCDSCRVELLENHEELSYEAGYDAGYEIGYDQGFDKGYTRGEEDAQDVTNYEAEEKANAYTD